MDGQKQKSKAALHRICDVLLNILLLVLLLVLFVQCALYMRQYAGIRRTSSEMPFDMRMLSASSADAYPDLEPMLLMPEVMAVNDGSGCRAVFSSAAVTEEMYGVIAECLANALKREALPAQSEDWSAAAEKNYIYAKFSSEIPYQVLFAFSEAQAGGDYQLRRAEKYIGVRELFLCATDAGMLYAVLVRGESGIYRFPLNSSRAAEDFYVYPEIYPDMFCLAELGDDAGGVRLTNESFAVRGLFASGGVMTLLTVNLDFLRLLDFNPDKLNYHMEPDGSYVYVEPHGVLRTGNEEFIYQAAENGGLPVAALNGGEKGDIYSYLRAASYLISWLENKNVQYTGGDASLRLESVQTDGNSVTLSFGYRCDNILIRSARGDYGLTLVFSGDRVTEIRYRMLIVRRSLEERRVMLQNWYRRMLDVPEETPMRLLYITDGSTDMITASWAALSTAERVEGASD